MWGNNMCHVADITILCHPRTYVTEGWEYGCEMIKNWFKDRKNVILLAVAALLCVVCFFARFLITHGASPLWAYLSDAFCVPGILYLFFGLFLYVLGKGLLEIYFYALYNLRRMFSRDDEDYMSFYQFTQAHNHRQVGFNYVFALVLGGVLLLIGLVFTFIYLGNR